jgi:hypothetical protein
VANVGLIVLLTAQVVVDRRNLAGDDARRCWRWALAGWAVVALVMGLARILSQRHWASDVYASWAVGLALACGILLLARVPRPAHLHPKARRHGDEPAGQSTRGGPA